MSFFFPRMNLKAEQSSLIVMELGLKSMDGTVLITAWCSSDACEPVAYPPQERAAADFASGGAATMDRQNSLSMRLGVVIRRSPGVTRWAKWSWRVTDLLPGAGDADWKLLRSYGDTREFHAATLSLTLHRSDAEAYRVGLNDTVPSIYVIMRRIPGDPPFRITLVTASPYEAQDYGDSGEEIVEKVPMSEGLAGWIRDFTLLHDKSDAFIKRQRDRQRVDLVQDGIGDARIRQMTDVYRAPGTKEWIQ